MLSRTHGLACEIKKHTSNVTTGRPNSSGVSCAMVLTAYFAISPAIGLSCHRHPQEALLLKNLMPASRHQDHATWPSAEAVTRQLTTSRPSHPASHVRDDRDTPLLMEAGRE